MIYDLLVFVSLFSGLAAAATSQRVIYTFHRPQKTWNVARNICEARFGQLIKLEDASHEEEVLYLFSQIWNSSVPNNEIWTGSHLISSSLELIYQDCLPSATNVTNITPGRSCVSVDVHGPGSFLYNYEPCSMSRAFICQRTIGDCWYKPIEDFTVLGDSSHVILNDTDETSCALECRNRVDGGNECWAVSYHKNYRTCILHFLGRPRFNKAPSVTYLFEDNDYLLSEDKTTLYLRICFEGEVDEGLYEAYTDSSVDPDIPNQECSITDRDPANTVCFCESTTDPPIPAAVPIADKIEELVKELTMDSSNTSAALRKKISAEDSRPSAMGVGYLGAGLIGIVFGGLVLLDAQVVIEGLIQLVRHFKGTA